MRPNILYLHTHDTGVWMEPYGFACHTPHLSALARKSTLFANAFSCAPTCSPSRAALLTGQTPHESGMLGLAHLGWNLRYPERHLAHFLGQNGYQSHLCGVEHTLGSLEAAQKCYGFVHRHNEEHSAAEYACLVLEERAKSHLGSSRQPFFLDVGFFQPHRSGLGFGATDGTIESDCAPVPAGLPATAMTRLDIANYIGAVQKADAFIGRVLQALERSGETENTIIFFTTDHGPAFPGYKGRLTDSGIHVALMLKVPGLERTGTQDALVSHLDIYPTLCQAAGLSVPPWLEGRSLLPLLRGEKAAIREEIFAECTFHAAFEPKRCVRTPRTKYIRRFFNGAAALPVPPNIDDSSSKAQWLDAGGATRQEEAEALYDLALDPGEGTNLAQSQPQLLQEMRDRLQLWMEKTHDPLLAESMQVPADMILAPPGALSPTEHEVITRTFPDADPLRWPTRR